MNVVTEVRSRHGLSLAVIVLEILPAALTVALFAAVGIAHVASRTLVVTHGYELSRLDQQHAELVRERDALELELATLRSPTRLEAAARERLGLVPASSTMLVHVKAR